MKTKKSNKKKKSLNSTKLIIYQIYQKLKDEIEDEDEIQWIPMSSLNKKKKKTKKKKIVRR